MINKALDSVGLPNINTIQTLVDCAKKLIKDIKLVKNDPKSVLESIRVNLSKCINAVQKVIESCNSPVIIGLTAAPYIGNPISLICTQLSNFSLKIDMMKMKAQQLAANLMKQIPFNVNKLLASTAKVATGVFAQDTLISN